jgi:hypothetical protein
MKSMTRWLGVFSIVASTTLVGCGSGYVEDRGPPRVVNAAFTLDMYINGAFIPEVYVDPGNQQDVPVRAGSNFEIRSTGPVQWTVAIDGQVVNPPVGTGVIFNGVNLLPTSVNSLRFAANASSQGRLVQTSVIEVTATSIADPRQEAQINILLTN